MQGGGIHQLQLVFLLLLLFVVVFGYLAQKLKQPYPIVLVIAGALLGLVPGIPRITLNPDIVFFVVLPPLLYSAAWLTSWREFHYNIVSIFLLAFGLVAFTVFGVAAGAHWLFPGFDWKMGFVLGAVIAPTDALAATSIANRIGLRKQIVDILEGESLVNDASGLLALEFGIAMVIHNQVPSISGGLLRLAYLIIAGIAVGLISGWLVNWAEGLVDHAPIEVAISIFVPYAVYLGAEAIGTSGVLAVVTCGLYLSRRSSQFFSPRVRLQAWAVWDSLTFILNGLVFVMIGLQLPYVLTAIRGYSRTQLLWDGVIFSVFVILLRLVWIFPGAFLAQFIRTHLFHQKTPMPPARGVLIVGWTGMRGVIALAAAIALPQVLENGQPFLQRNLIIFLAFSVIFVTLVLQGLTLPPLVRALGVAEAGESNMEEKSARQAMLQAALDFLQNSRQNDDATFATIYEDIATHYQQDLLALSIEETAAESGKDGATGSYRRHTRLLRDLIGVERQTAVRLRNEGQINDETLRQLERELDLREARSHPGH
jgi:CPA1 family monovalent cation:H+ antiporter